MASKTKDKTNFSEPSFFRVEQFYNSTPDDFLEVTPRPSAKNHMGTVVKLSGKKKSSEKLVLSLAMFGEHVKTWERIKSGRMGV